MIGDDGLEAIHISVNAAIEPWTRGKWDKVDWPVERESFFWRACTQDPKGEKAKWLRDPN